MRNPLFRNIQLCRWIFFAPLSETV